MNNLIELKDCILLGSGAEGSVYLTSEGLALKCFNNILVRDYVNGENLSNYLSKNGLSYSLSIELIDLIEDLKILKFKRINIRNAHIFINKNEKLMVIDPRKPYTKIMPYPKDIIKILLKLNLFDTFLKNLLSYRPDLLDYWIDGYNFVVNNYRHVLRYG